MIPAEVESLAEALSRYGQWGVFIRTTETGEPYIDIATTATDQPIESVWFDPQRAVWGDQYEHGVTLDDDYNGVAQAILYTLRDAD